MNRAFAPRAISMLAAALVLAACATTGRVPTKGGPIDARATPETRALLANLKKLAPDHVLFGHQDDLAYGVSWWAEPGRSDVKEAAGAFPALYGWEIGDLEKDAARNLDSISFTDMRRWIGEGYRRGGAITISWHMNNPATGGNAWDTTRAIHTILPGGIHHDAFKGWLDRFAAFATSLQVDGTPIPVIFRPYHEHTGSWFWWGEGHVTPDEYARLWRFTVEYLRDVKGVHNLLWAYSTDFFDTDEEYLAHYPGDAYVDVLGYDDYGSLRADSGVAAMTDKLRSLVRMADARGKLAALTETGLEGVPDPTWWTGRLLPAIASDPEARRIAYVLVWRNAYARVKPGHHYAPYAGHPSAADFAAFYRDPFVLFESELPPLYR